MATQTTRTDSFSDVLTTLTNDQGHYVDGHSNRYVSSTYFVILALGEERHVCPIHRAKNGSVWVTTLNPIKLTADGTAWLSTRAIHTLNHQGDTLWEAAKAFNSEFKPHGAHILSIFTVL